MKMKNITTMTARELDFYKAGILDAHEGKDCIPCNSKRCNELAEQASTGKQATLADLQAALADVKAYSAGVKFETNRQLKLDGII